MGNWAEFRAWWALPPSSFAISIPHLRSPDQSTAGDEDFWQSTYKIQHLASFPICATSWIRVLNLSGFLRNKPVQLKANEFGTRTLLDFLPSLHGQVVFCVSRIPTISISSPTFTIPRSIRPVTTVPRPEMENTSSIGIRKVPSTARSGVGMYVSSASANCLIAPSPNSPASPSSASLAEPLIMGTSSPGKS